MQPSRTDRLRRSAGFRRWLEATGDDLAGRRSRAVAVDPQPWPTASDLRRFIDLLAKHAPRNRARCDDAVGHGPTKAFGGGQFHRFRRRAPVLQASPLIDAHSAVAHGRAITRRHQARAAEQTGQDPCVCSLHSIPRVPTELARDGASSIALFGRIRAPYQRRARTASATPLDADRGKTQTGTFDKLYCYNHRRRVQGRRRRMACDESSLAVAAMAHLRGATTLVGGRARWSLYPSDVISADIGRGRYQRGRPPAWSP